MGLRIESQTKQGTFFKFVVIPPGIFVPCANVIVENNTIVSYGAHGIFAVSPKNDFPGNFIARFNEIFVTNASGIKASDENSKSNYFVKFYNFRTLQLVECYYLW